MAFGMLYWLLPRLFQTPLWSRKLAEVPPAWLLAPADRLARRIVQEYGQPHDDASCIALSVMR